VKALRQFFKFETTVVMKKKKRDGSEWEQRGRARSEGEENREWEQQV
jgi:hypothetical protein